MASLSYPKTTMQIQLGANLKPYHTFGIEQSAAQLVVANRLTILRRSIALLNGLAYLSLL